MPKRRVSKTVGTHFNKEFFFYQLVPSFLSFIQFKHDYDKMLHPFFKYMALIIKNTGLQFQSTSVPSSTIVQAEYVNCAVFSGR